MEEAFRIFKSAREYLTPVLQESAFLERGMLTPEEFVRAGDHLVRASPSWTWEVGDKSQIKPYLPENKQFLVTRGVPSYQRVSSLHSASLVQENIQLDEGGEEWCHTHFDPNKQEDDDIEIVDKSSLEEGDGKPSAESSAATTAAAKPAADAEYLDMEDESLALDGMTISDTNTTSKTSQIVRVRRYDVSITYDNYYRTPRIWLYGYDENGSALEPTAIFEDVLQDYAKRTVTIDPHPHLNKQHASVHPCQHAPAMLSIIQALQECGTTPTVDQYLFIFLKFIQSVVPTIEYDYTMDVQVRAKEEK